MSNQVGSNKIRFLSGLTMQNYGLLTDNHKKITHKKLNITQQTPLQTYIWKFSALDYQCVTKNMLYNIFFDSTQQ